MPIHTLSLDQKDKGVSYPGSQNDQPRKLQFQLTITRMEKEHE